MMRRILQWLVVILVVGVVSEARADGGDAHVGIYAEMPLFTTYRTWGAPRPDDYTYEKIENSDAYFGPVLHESDKGPQVPVMLGIGVPIWKHFVVGGRLGGGTMCSDGPSSGDHGKDWNYAAEVYGQFVFRPNQRIRPYGSLGPHLGHTCTGNTVDAWEVTYIGFHFGVGSYFDITSWFSLFGEFRGSANWGELRFHSHGETAVRWDASDLRGKLLIGATFWI